MTRHEHHRAQGGRSPTVERISSIFLSALPTLLLIPSFVLAAVSSARKDWVYRKSYIDSVTPLSTNGFDYRSPWWSCTMAVGKSKSVTANSSTTLASPPWTQSCSRNHAPRGLCDFSAPSNDQENNPIFCQQLCITAQLLYAGCALIGAALFLTFLLTATTQPWTRHRLSRRTHVFHETVSYLAFLLVLLTSLGAFCLFMGTLVGSNALTVLQFPNVDWFSHSTAGSDPAESLFSGPWLLGRAVGMCAAGAVLAGVASYSVGMVWELPRGAALRAHDERDPHRGMHNGHDDAEDRAKES